MDGRTFKDPPRLPPEAVATGTKGRVLEAALGLFARHGFHGTSMRDLARAVGLQVGALYAHYPSKERLLAELVQLGHEVHHGALQRALLACGAEPVAQIRALVHAHARLHAEYPMLALIVNEEWHALPADLAAPALALRGQSQALLTEVLRRGTAAGVFHPLHAEVTAAAIGGMGVRIAYWYRPGYALDPEHIGDIHAQLALRMLGVEEVRP